MANKSSRGRGRPPLWDPSRYEPDDCALMIMLDGAKEKPIEPYALAKAALARVRHMFWVAATLKKAGLFELSEDALRGYLYEIEAKAEDEETLERWTQAGREAFARGEVSVIDYSPYRYGDDLTHTKRLGNKFKDLLAQAEISLFLKDFPDGWTEDNVSGYCRTEEEKRQEALKIVEELWNEQLERGDTEADDLVWVCRGMCGGFIQSASVHLKS